MSVSQVLLVDDEANILSALRRSLHQEKVEIITTNSPREALELVSHNSYAVVISDQRMPDIEGTGLLEEIKRISPDTVRILLTGYADTQAAIDAINRGSVYRFLTKPWDDDELRLIVRQAVFHFELLHENRALQALTRQQNLELIDVNKNLEQKVLARTREIQELNVQMEKTFLESIKVMAGLSEMHSIVIGSHAKRVAMLCKALGMQMGLSPKDLFQLEVAATLHDIGKIGIPSEVLLKPTQFLKRQESEILLRHALQGEAIVRMVSNLGEAAQMVRHHHENFDGSGYPDQLFAQEIPLGARIIAVVDAYDKALNQRMQYEMATPEKAVDALKSHCLKRFDPEVVSELAHHIQAGAGKKDNSVEIEIHARDLHPGMILSRDLITLRGVLLLPQGSVIQAENIHHLHNFLEIDPVVEGIFVYRRNKVVPNT